MYQVTVVFIFRCTLAVAKTKNKKNPHNFKAMANKFHLRFLRFSFSRPKRVTKLPKFY